jgi:hypothetical protein
MGLGVPGPIGGDHAARGIKAMKKLDTGDKVRVRMVNGQPGPTVYEITGIGHGSLCAIREISTVAGRQYAEQTFDLSLLVRDQVRRYVRVER